MECSNWSSMVGAPKAMAKGTRNSTDQNSTKAQRHFSHWCGITSGQMAMLSSIPTKGMQYSRETCAPNSVPCRIWPPEAKTVWQRSATIISAAAAADSFFFILNWNPLLLFSAPAAATLPCASAQKLPRADFSLLFYTIAKVVSTLANPLYDVNICQSDS